MITHSTLSHSTAPHFLDQAINTSELLSSGKTNQNLSLSLYTQITISFSTLGKISITIASSFQLYNLTSALTISQSTAQFFFHP
jgi:hypothetical protein